MYTFFILRTSHKMIDCIVELGSLCEYACLVWSVVTSFRQSWESLFLFLMFVDWNNWNETTWANYSWSIVRAQCHAPICRSRHIVTSRSTRYDLRKSLTNIPRSFFYNKASKLFTSNNFLNIYPNLEKPHFPQSLSMPCTVAIAS